MLDRDQLETFATVAEQQSFERAATALNVTRGAVSQRVKALEESLSTILLLRDKPVTPTPAGDSGPPLTVSCAPTRDSDRGARR